MLIGNLGKDAETQFLPSGSAVTEFSIATARRWKDQQSGEWREETDWHNVKMWRGENVAKYLLKGTQVYVEGRLQTRSWEGQDGQKRYRTEVVAEASGLMLLSGRGDDGGGGGGSYSKPQQAPAAARPAPKPADDMGVGEDDVPF